MSLDLKRLIAQRVIPRLVKMHIQAHLGQSKDHFLEILKSHFRCNFLFREELMMCTNDPEAGRNYCSRRFVIFRVKNYQIHQKIDLGAVLVLDAKRRMRAPKKIKLFRKIFFVNGF